MVEIDSGVPVRVTITKTLVESLCRKGSVVERVGGRVVVEDGVPENFHFAGFRINDNGDLDVFFVSDEYVEGTEAVQVMPVIRIVPESGQK